jgi:hypothetical protein
LVKSRPRKDRDSVCWKESIHTRATAKARVSAKNLPPNGYSVLGARRLTLDQAKASSKLRDLAAGISSGEADRHDFPLLMRNPGVKRLINLSRSRKILRFPRAKGPKTCHPRATPWVFEG